MVKKKSTLRALLMSVLALLACVSMLVGSTFAWFTDSVSSMNNIIKSGNLDIELEYTLDGTTWTAVNDNTSIFGEDDLWEPGHTVVAGLRVKNVGSLALKYALSTHIYLEKTGTNVYGEEFKLSDYLDVYYGEAADEAAVKAIFDGDRAAALAALTAGDFNIDLTTDSNLLSLAEEYALLAITMPTTVGNEANHKTGTAAPYIRFGIDLYATQYTYEEDSFDDQYDAGASVTNPQKYPYAIVTDDGPQTVYSESLFGGGYSPIHGTNLDLDATYTFVAPQDDTDYKDWAADYEISVVTPDSNKLPEGAVILSGQYDFISTTAWQSFYTPEVASGDTYRLLKIGAEAMGYPGVRFTYEAIQTMVGTFKCGVAEVDDLVPAGTVMTVALKLYNEDASGNVLAEKTVGVFTYTFK